MRQPLATVAHFATKSPFRYTDHRGDQVHLTTLLGMRPLPPHDLQSIHLMQPVLAIRLSTLFALLLLLVRQPLAAGEGVQPVPLAGTKLLTREGDIASQLISAADVFLLRQIDQSKSQRARHWHRDLATPAAYQDSIEPNRQQLRKMLGLRDSRNRLSALTLQATTEQSALVGRGPGYEIFAVRWPAFGNVHGEGLLLVPTGREPAAGVIALPHCEVTPEQLCGLANGLVDHGQFARRLAENGCLVVVPTLIDRAVKQNGISNREWIHRAAYEMGRTMTGYEVNKVLALVDWLTVSREQLPIGVIGWGDGGLIACYSAAVDPRIDAVCASGALGNMDQLWNQPIDRMVFSLLTQFGDAELAALVAPRSLVVEVGTAPQSNRPRAEGECGGPYEITTANMETVRDFTTKAQELVAGLGQDQWVRVVESEAPGSDAALESFLHSLSYEANLVAAQSPPDSPNQQFGETARLNRQMDELDRHTQALLRKSHWVRKERFWDKLDTSSIEAYEASIEPFRQEFREEVIGRFDLDLLPPNAHTRLIAESDKWKRYEVVVDVFDGLFAYGILTVPTDIKHQERRPVVVCQHGLEGRPQSVIGEKDYRYYKAFATALAERGFVTFAPQNLYIFGDRFRTLQRKANSLGKTLFSIMTPQHQQIVDWLESQPFVDPDRIAFYGLSYGGKTAMRVPPLVTDYCLSICAADFNEWVDKNASTQNPRSYMPTIEYEIFEWDLGHTYNYAEMAALIAPRPFMVERGHFDGVADDWTVAWEYARVRFLYAARLNLPGRTEIEWFVGPHSINGVGTFEFLERHLDWPPK